MWNNQVKYEEEQKIIKVLYAKINFADEKVFTIDRLRKFERGGVYCNQTIYSKLKLLQNNQLLFSF